MNDVINRKDAIGAILSVEHIAELSDGDAVIRVSAVNYVLGNLPSAQPEKRTDERTETHACDCISRQAAIDALDEQIEQCDKALSSFDISMRDEFAVKAERASLVAFRETLEYLPSAQPEIIHCRECKHWKKTIGDECWSLGDCDAFDKKLVMCEGFCAWAERREDEDNNQI